MANLLDALLDQDAASLREYGATPAEVASFVIEQCAHYGQLRMAATADAPAFLAGSFVMPGSDRRH